MNRWTASCTGTVLGSSVDPVDPGQYAWPVGAGASTLPHLPSPPYDLGAASRQTHTCIKHAQRTITYVNKRKYVFKIYGAKECAFIDVHSTIQGRRMPV